jgi:hypothetical protein
MLYSRGFNVINSHGGSYCSNNHGGEVMTKSMWGRSYDQKYGESQGKEINIAPPPPCEGH